MQNKHKCCWVLVPNSKDVSAIYCGKDVKYKIVKDDDENKIRKYEAFCPEHKIAAEKQNEDIDE